MYTEKVRSIRRFLENSDSAKVNQEYVKPVYGVLDSLEESFAQIEKNLVISEPLLILGD